MGLAKNELLASAWRWPSMILERTYVVVAYLEAVDSWMLKF